MTNSESVVLPSDTHKTTPNAAPLLFTPSEAEFRENGFENIHKATGNQRPT